MTSPGPAPRNRSGADSDPARSELLARLHSNSEGDLLALLDDPALTDTDVAALARRRNLPRAVFDRLARSERWIGAYDVKVALVRNPRTPRHLALRLPQHLLRRELAEVARDVNVHPGVRRLAEHYLRIRLEELSPGERIAIGRSASPALLRMLLEDKDLRVVESALANPRLDEEAVLQAARNAQLAPATLAAVATDPKWACRYPVRVALIRNPGLPADSAQAILPELLFQDLLGLMENPGVSLAVRLGARRQLAAKVAGLPARQRLSLAAGNIRSVLDILLADPDPRVVLGVLRTARLAEGQIVTLARTAGRPEVLQALGRLPAWRGNLKLKDALLSNPQSPPELLRQVTEWRTGTP